MLSNLLILLLVLLESLPIPYGLRPEMEDAVVDPLGYFLPNNRISDVSDAEYSIYFYK